MHHVDTCACGTHIPKCIEPSVSWCKTIHSLGWMTNERKEVALKWLNKVLFHHEPPEWLLCSFAQTHRVSGTLIISRLLLHVVFYQECLQGNHLSVTAMRQRTSCCWWTAPGASDAPTLGGSEISWRAWWRLFTSDRTTFRSVRVTVLVRPLVPSVGCRHSATHRGFRCLRPC